VLLIDKNKTQKFLISTRQVVGHQLMQIKSERRVVVERVQYR